MVYVLEKTPRIGVYVCHCGKNIGGFLDVQSLVEYAKGLPNVVFSKDNLYTCSEAGLNDIRGAITDQKLNRVIVASCTPRTHEPLFRNTCKEAGLNPYLFEVGAEEFSIPCILPEPKAVTSGS